MKGPGINNPNRQKGLALLLLVITIVLTIITYMVSQLSMTDIEYQQQVKTRTSLKKAKQALLAFAMNYPDTAMGLGNLTQGPGNFPCPDDDFDGDSDNPGFDIPGCTSGGPGTIGRFPWAEVGVEELRDGSGELLWYAISSNYVNATGGVVNTSAVGEITLKKTDGSIEVDGTTINGIVAVIIAPGDILVRDDGLVQSRSTAAERDAPQNYLDIAYVGDVLEEDNASYINNDVNGFIRGPIFNAANQIIVNDQIEVITYGEIMSLVHAKAANEIEIAISDYVNNCGIYPVATAFDPAQTIADGAYTGTGTNEGHISVDLAEWGAGGCAEDLLPQWVEGEEWHKYSYYHYAIDSPPDCVAGCLSNIATGANDIDALIVFAGRQIGAQQRGVALSNLADYFEIENNNGDTFYDSNEIEDYLHVITQ